MFLTAQVSIYPLRQPHLSPAIQAMLDSLRRHGLEVEPGPMSTLAWGEDNALFQGLRDAFLAASQDGEAVMTVTVSNACPLPTRGVTAPTPEQQG